MDKVFYTYIVRCSDSSYYVGVTNDIIKRIEEHNSPFFPGTYCHNRRPLKLLLIRVFLDAKKAIAYEKQLKGWSRKKKEALILYDLAALHYLASCKNHTSHIYYKGNQK